MAQGTQTESRRIAFKQTWRKRELGKLFGTHQYYVFNQMHKVNQGLLFLRSQEHHKQNINKANQHRMRISTENQTQQIRKQALVETRRVTEKPLWAKTQQIVWNVPNNLLWAEFLNIQTHGKSTRSHRRYPKTETGRNMKNVACSSCKHSPKGQAANE